MNPRQASPDFIDRGFMHAIASGKSMRGVFAWHGGSDLLYLRPCQLGRVASFSHADQAGPNAMPNVLGWRNVFKVTESVVRFVAVLVIDLVFSRATSDERAHDKLVNGNGSPFSSSTKRDEPIATSRCVLNKKPRRITRSMYYRSHSAGIGHLVTALKSLMDKRAPLFVVRSRHWRHVVRIVNVFPRSTRAHIEDGFRRYAVIPRQVAIPQRAASNLAHVVSRQLGFTVQFSGSASRHIAVNYTPDVVS